MVKKRRSIVYYSDNKIKLSWPTSVKVDEFGEAWLSPRQVKQLEFMHEYAPYYASNKLRRSSKLLLQYNPPPPVQGPSVADEINNLASHTVAVNAIAI